MAEHRPPPTLTAADYAAIEAAVMETARGRWFLAEFARRNRHADTGTLLAALARLEAAIATPPPATESPAKPDVPEPDSRNGAAVSAPALRDAWRALQSVGGETPADGSADAAALALARRLGGFAQDARDMATAVKAAARDGAAQASAETLRLVAELAQVTARRFALVGSDVIAAERRLGALATGISPPEPGAVGPRPERGSSEPARQNPPDPMPKEPEPPARPAPPPALGSYGGQAARPDKPSLADLQKMNPLERLKALS